MIKLEDLTRASAFREQGSTLDRPLDHLTACHRRIEDRLAALGCVIPFLNDKREEALQVISNALSFFKTNGAWHTADEEESVFPRLSPSLTTEENMLLDRLDQEHRRAESLHLELERVVAAMAAESPIAPALADEYAGLVASLTSLYSTHIEVEDSRLMAIGARLTLGELAAISREMKVRRGLLKGG